MRFNPYSLVLILAFSIIVSITNKTIKNREYEKTTNDSCIGLVDSTRVECKM